MMKDLIFISGAPGSGKSTITKLLEEKLHSPAIDFGWLRELHLDREWKQASAEEEQMAFENLVFMLRNYIKHGYKNMLVNDLTDRRIQGLPQLFSGDNYLIVSLVLEDEDELKKRMLDESRDSGFRDVEAALKWNQLLQERPAVKNEIKLDNSVQDAAKTVKEILKLVE